MSLSHNFGTATNLYELLKFRAEQNPEAIALLAPDRKPLNYRSLYVHVEKVAKWLNGFGITRNDRVAIVLPNGPEMATAFLGVASSATSAPLNPAYRASEFDFYLSDLNTKALLIWNGFDSPAREVAQAREIPILEISVNSDGEAGVFSFVEGGRGVAGKADFATPSDVALVLHTSGTTSRPKIVPLTHKNICISAHNIQEILQLTNEDRCLNVMPLFHIHGLMAAVLSSLSAGASVVCTPGFQADPFFGWLSYFRPTWYTAVPTMHQTVLSRIQADPDPVVNSSLRFLRSSSSSLPPQVMKGLEDAFNAPMIEAYGMTEASHQMASNPLPPLQRKPGTVGIAAGPEIRIMDEAGNFLSEGEAGEIVIRGENVTIGYENNPKANESAFTNGWFCTGDQGVMDVDGYLRITGRLKEIVNRGGEKIAPREVDEALLDHPDVAQAVAFAMPHPTLGEDLAAAVVLRGNSKTTEKELREFAFSKLADYKVPSQIVIVNEIPKGPTGKLQRIGLAEKLASNMKAEYVQPRNSFEETLAGIWAEVLKLGRVGIRDNFFSLGGDSLSAVSVTLSIEKLVDKKLHPSILFRAPTIEQLSSFLKSDHSDNESYLVSMQPDGNKKPIFLVPGHGGDVFTFVELARLLGPDQPVYVFRFPEPARQDNEVANLMLKGMAASYIKEMRALQPEGPYLLCGFCYGGELAFEMAQQLRAMGESAVLVGIIYAYLPGSIRSAPGFVQKIRYHFGQLLDREPKDRLAYLAERSRNVLEKMSRKFVPSVTRRMTQTLQITTGYFPMYYPGKITLFRPLEQAAGLYHDPKMGWNGLAADMDVYEVPGNRISIFKEPNVRILAQQLKESLERANEM